jgi:hypothetical protein
MVTMLVRGSAAFLFTPWFLFLGIGVVFGRYSRMDLSGHPWWRRALVNLLYLVVSLLAALLVTC